MRNWDLLSNPGLRDYGHAQNMRRRPDGGIDIELTARRSPTGAESMVPVGEVFLADMFSIAAVVIAPPGILVEARIALIPYSNLSQIYLLAGTSVLGNGGPQEVYLKGPVRGDALPFNGRAGGFLYVNAPPEGTVISITGWQLALNEVAVGPMTLPPVVVEEPPIASSVPLGGLVDPDSKVLEGELGGRRKMGAGALLLIGAAALAMGGRRKRN